MNKRYYNLYIAVLVFVSLFITIYIALKGASYYSTSMEERFYHPDHKLLKPNGLYGHGLGIFGTLMIMIGVFGYMARKRMKSLSRVWVLKHWLEIHIFLCTLGSILIMYHTAFKLGGIVSVSFWSMVAVVLSGVIGRFIYLQIPRTIQGRELSLAEISEMRNSLSDEIKKIGIQSSTTDFISSLNMDTGNNAGSKDQNFNDKEQLNEIKKKLKSMNIPANDKRKLIQSLKSEISMKRKLHRLELMQRLFRYWHIAHLPFALIMLIIMIIHVAVAFTLGYNWIF